MKILKLFQYLVLVVSATAAAQMPADPNSRSISGKSLFTNAFKSTPLFGNSFIENIGQYDGLLKQPATTAVIEFGFEGFDMPVLFTKNGLVYLHRQMKNISHAKAERLEKRKNGIAEFLRNNPPVNKQIAMEWVGANADVEIIPEELTQCYHTYGLLQGKAKAYRKITYKGIYPGIDIVYRFITGTKPGFEYCIVLHPGADPALVKMRYSGHIKKIIADKKGNLLINSPISGIIQSRPESYPCSETAEIFNANSADRQTKISSAFIITGNEASFSITGNYDKTKMLVVDPFVSSTAVLTGTNAGKATDVDFDYDGNVYVSSASINTSKFAKFSSTGALLWTYDRLTSFPGFSFSYGGWVVEKGSGKVYLGQGFNPIGGTQVIRLNASGVYDNYITTQVFSFAENWKMTWNCSNGIPQILLGGGTTISNTNFAVVQPPNPIITPINITGIPYPGPGSGYSQDAVDLVVDPTSNDMYSTYASVGTPQLNNKIFKHSAPYTSASILWQAPTGYNNMGETGGRPYLISPVNYGGADNSMNLLAVNSNYLFYWDGKNLKAFNKATGAGAGAPLITPLTTKMQGGIYADECNNIFVGYVNGLIKVYKFDGNSFDDNAAPDISVAGYPTASVYDLAYNPTDNILYACGNGFVASFDISTYCPGTADIYTLKIIADCPNNSITASLVPAPPVGTVVTYSLFDAATALSSNTTGIFTGLNPATLYTLKATINESCGGIRVVKDFSYPATFLDAGDPAVTICSGLSTVLNATSNAASVSWTPATGLSNANILQPTASPLTTTQYFITATNGICSILDSVTVFVKPSPVANAGNDTTICFDATIRLHGSGGNGIYRWSPTAFLSSSTLPDPFLLNARVSIIYTLAVKDTNECSSLKTDQVKITVLRQPKLFAGNDTVLVINQPLPLFAADLNNTGFTQYLWQPATGLNNPLLQNPVAMPDRDIIYLVTAKTPEGCTGTDEVAIRVFNKIDIYVPNTFTPNKDGLNDKLYAIPVGIKQFNYFRIYNRFGNLVFSTTDFHNGWDGRIDAAEQSIGTFAWMAEGIDYRGTVVQRKGTVLLLR